MLAVLTMRTEGIRIRHKFAAWHKLDLQDDFSGPGNPLKELCELLEGASRVQTFKIVDALNVYGHFLPKIWLKMDKRGKED